MRTQSLTFSVQKNRLFASISHTQQNEGGFGFAGAFGRNRRPISSDLETRLREWYGKVFGVSEFPGEDVIEYVVDGEVRYVKSERHSARMLEGSLLGDWISLCNSINSSG